MRTPKSSDSLLFRAVALGALACILFGGAAVAATHQVEVGHNGGINFFDDQSGTSTTTINVGDTVTWVWDSSFHSTTSGACPGGNCQPDGMWDSGAGSAPKSFSFTFTTAGTFPYHCSVHLAMMQGTVVVQAQTANPPVASFNFSPSGPVMGSTVTFTDTSTGTPTSWAWNFGDPASGSSNTSTAQNPTHVFQSAGTFTVSETATNAGGSNTTTKSVTVSAGGATVCTPDATTLCLNGGRFMAQMHWTKPDGTSGDGNGVKLTDDSGYFWFFDPTNIEAVMKVLNGCALDNAYWVFLAGLTNVQVDTTVTDTQTGAVFTKQNPQGVAFAPVQSTNAFPTSCP
jgi:PKD repeat protein